MRISSGTRVALASLVSALTLAGCGVTDTVTNRYRDATTDEPGVATIGVLAPLTGPQRVAGNGVLASVQAAVHDAAALPGWKLEVLAVDSALEDGGESGAAATKQLLEDADELLEESTLVAIVGGLTAAEVITVAPVATDTDVPLLSPADQEPTHVRGADLQSPDRPWRAYGVTTVPPSAQVLGLVEHLAGVLGLGKVGILVDGSVAARDRVDVLEQALERWGVSVAARGTVAARRDSARAQVARLSAAGAEAVITLGDAEHVAAVQAAADWWTGKQEVRVPVAAVAELMGIDAEGSGSLPAGLDGVLVARGGIDPTAGRTQLEQRTDVPPGPYGTAAYDAAALVVAGLGSCLPLAEPGEVAPPVAEPSRGSCGDDIIFSSAAGITGDITLDQFGVRVGAAAPVGRVRGGSWQRVES